MEPFSVANRSSKSAVRSGPGSSSISALTAAAVAQDAAAKPPHIWARGGRAFEPGSGRSRECELLRRLFWASQKLMAIGA